MSAAAGLVAELASAGVDPDLLSRVAQELFTAEAERNILARRRKSDADRQQAIRDRNATSRDVTDSHATERDVTGRVSLDKKDPQTPERIKPIPSPPCSPPSSQKRGTRLADDFEAPEDWIVWAMKKRGWSRAEAIDEAECFARYWQAKPGKDAVKLDWPKTWQNWATNSRRPNQTAPPRLGALC